MDELDRRHDVVTMAYACLLGFALEDLVAESVLLPLVGRNDAGDLTRQVDTGRLAEAVLLGPVREAIDAELAGHLEEERVTRVPEAAVDVAGTEADVVPVVEPRRAQRQ